MKKMKALVVLCMLLNVLPSYALGFDLFGLCCLTSPSSEYEISNIQNPYLNVTELTTGSYVQKEGAKEADEIVPVSQVDKTQLDDMKVGESEYTEILGLISYGEGGIHDAAREGGIKKIHFVDKEQKGFNYFGLKFYTTKTIVYGE